MLHGAGMACPDPRACSPRQPCPRMRALVRSQVGVLSLVQAREHGWSVDRLRVQLDAGRWRRVHRGVYVTHTGKVTYAQRIYAAILYCGHGALASSETSLWLADPVGELPSKV